MSKDSNKYLPDRSNYGSGSGYSGSGYSGSGYSGSGYSGSGYSGSGYGYSTYMKPTIAFEAHGIEFWGSAMTKLDIDEFTSNDLIVNCSGTEIKSEPFVKKSPVWMNLPSEESGLKAHQVLLGWKDFSPPPRDIDIRFWEMIVRKAIAKGIKRIFVCCGAGQGRTGTALSALLLACGVINEPDDAVDFIRESYSKSAVETQDQEIYIFNLIYDIQALLEDASDNNDDDDFPQER